MEAQKQNSFYINGALGSNFPVLVSISVRRARGAGKSTGHVPIDSLADALKPCGLYVVRDIDLPDTTEQTPPGGHPEPPPVSRSDPPHKPGPDNQQNPVCPVAACWRSGAHPWQRLVPPETMVESH